MREYGSNINLPSLDNLFSSEKERQDAKLEKMKIRRSMFSVMSPKVHLMPTVGSLSKISKNSSGRL